MATNSIPSFLNLTATTLRDAAAELEGVALAVEAKEDFDNADLDRVQRFADALLRSAARSALLLKSLDPSNPPRLSDTRVAA